MNKKLTDMKEVSKIAQTFMRKWDCGVLSTQYELEEGAFPFGSLTPFVLTEECDVIVLISDLAIHTKNILANPKVGFTVFDMESSHKQASPRVMLTGNARLIEEQGNPEEFQKICDRYLSFFPQAKNYFKAHSFYFYSIRPNHIHFIRTFGQIYNFSSEGNWTQPTPEWKGSESDAIEHMNDDHKDALQRMTKKYLEKDSSNVSLLAVDGSGFHLKVDDEIHYMSFLGNATDANGLHREFVALAKSC
jgi:putative heme iron utilization protein